jgi:hypothetical protein
MTTVSDEHVATLRTFLKGDIEGHNRMYERLDREAAKAGYLPLLVSAFFEAVDRRFAKDSTKTDVVAFVGNVRARSEALAGIDPQAAERMILAIYTDENVDDIDDGTKGELYPILLAGLIADEQLDDAGLDAFLSEARKLADEWLA